MKKGNKLKTLAVATMATTAIITPTAHAEKIPEKKREIIHSQALVECKMKGEGYCQKPIFNQVYQSLVAGYWRREWAHRERDFDYALKVAAKYYGVPFAWLKACNKAEGGAGPWKWNGGKYLKDYPYKPSGSSGAGGPMQFMEGTFYSYSSDKAVKRVVPKGYRQWKKRAAHAFTAAYMFRIGQSGHWTASAC